MTPKENPPPHTSYLFWHFRRSLAHRLASPGPVHLHLSWRGAGLVYTHAGEQDEKNKWVTRHKQRNQPQDIWVWPGGWELAWSHVAVLEIAFRGELSPRKARTARREIHWHRWFSSCVFVHACVYVCLYVCAPTIEIWPKMNVGKLALAIQGFGM